MRSVLREASVALVVGLISTGTFVVPSFAQLAESPRGGEGRDMTDIADGSPPSVDTSQIPKTSTSQQLAGLPAFLEPQAYDRRVEDRSITLVRNLWIKWLVHAHR
jgi:hypothetical protein